jgi:hypothetical protein
MVLAFRKPALALIFSMAFAIDVLTNSTTSSFSDKPTLSSSSSLSTHLHSFSNTVSSQTPSGSKPTTSPIPLNAFPNWISMSYESQQTNTRPVPTLPTTAIPIWEEAYASADNPYYITVFLDQDSALSSSCGAIWSAYFYEWMATADIKTMDPPFATSLQWETSTGAVLYYGYDWTTSAALTITGSTFLDLSLTQAQGTTGQKDFTASPPCCRTCTYSLGEIQVYHWPSSTSPAVATLTNADGYTL